MYGFRLILIIFAEKLQKPIVYDISRTTRQ